MASKEIKKILADLVQDYLIEKGRNQVWQRENATGYSVALGKLLGACAVLNLDIDETDKGLALLTRLRKKVVIRVDK